MCNAPNCVNWDVAGAMELFCKLVLVALLKQKTEPHTKKTGATVKRVPKRNVSAQSKTCDIPKISFRPTTFSLTFSLSSFSFSHLF